MIIQLLYRQQTDIFLSSAWMTQEQKTVIIQCSLILPSAHSI